jgi:hypothetical protein
MPTNVSKGSWCPTCAHRERLTLGEMQALAVRRGGECLSQKYLNNEIKLRWRCASGHEWEAGTRTRKRGTVVPTLRARGPSVSRCDGADRLVARGPLFVGRVRQR